MIPDGYKVVELNQRVPNIDPVFFSKFKRRADKRAAKLNNSIDVWLPSYRYEVCDWLDGRWAVVVMQNQLQKI